MATIAKTFNQGVSESQSLGLIQRYNAFIEKLKFSYYGLITMTITIGSCLGGIATMYVFQNDAPLWQFVVAVAISMANNVAAIAQAPIKWVFNLFALSVLVNSILILVNSF